MGWCPEGAEGVDASLGGHGEQRRVGREQPDDCSLHFRRPIGARRVWFGQVDGRDPAAGCRVEAGAGLDERSRSVHRAFPRGPDFPALPRHRLCRPRLLVLDLCLVVDLLDRPEVDSGDRVPGEVAHGPVQYRVGALVPGEDGVSRLEVVERGPDPTVVEEEGIGGRYVGSSFQLAVGAAAHLKHGAAVQVVVEEPAGLAVQARGDGTAARDQQVIARDGQGSLWGHSPEGDRAAVWLVHEGRAETVVRPEQLAGFLPQCVDECAHERPDTGSEVDDPVCGGDGAAAGWPSRNQAAVAEDLACVAPAAEAPFQCAVGLVEAVEEAVVTHGEDSAVHGDRGQAHGSIGHRVPELLACPCVQGDYRVGSVRRDEHSRSRHHRLVAAVERHAVLVDRVLPRRLQRRVLADPLQVHLRWELSGRGSATRRVVSPHGPVGCVGGQANGGAEKQGHASWGEGSGHGCVGLRLQVGEIQGRLKTSGIHSASTWKLGSDRRAHDMSSQPFSM